MPRAEYFPNSDAVAVTARTLRFTYRTWAVLQRYIAGLAIMMLLPLFAVLYPLVRLSSPGPFFYSQMRPGRNGTLFRAYKIRTMKVGADRNTAAARSVKSSDPMVTPIGKLLRDLKLDELPQLWNVVRGEMALVGPRPIAVSFQSELEAKIPGFSSRLLVKPGVTSLPQVCVLESEDPEHVVADWTRRFQMERHYIANQSVRYDLIVIGLTLALVLRKLLAVMRPLRGAVLKATAVLLAVAALFFLSGCSSLEGDRMASSPHSTSITRASGQSVNALAAPSDVVIQPLKAKPFVPEKLDPDYRVGTGDVLKVNVFGETGMNDLSIRVESDGRIQLPAIASQKVSGLTLREIQAKLTSAYKEEFNAPWVMVTMENFGSRPIYLLGEFNTPGVSYLQRPTNLLNAVAMGGGTTAKAHLPGARVIRGESILPVDIKAVLKEGRLEQNIWLKGGDTIFVPSAEDLKFYVIGAVQAPGVFPYGDGRQTLIRALTAAGGPVSTKASLGSVRVIRTLSPIEGQVIEIDAAKVLAGKVPDFELKPDDVVFVAQTGLSRWNDVVQQILPTLSLLNAPIQPFMALGIINPPPPPEDS